MNTEQIRREIEESKFTALGRWVHHHRLLVFGSLAALFTFSVFTLFNPEYTVAAVSGVLEGISRLHDSLSKPRFSAYRYFGLLFFTLFIAILIHESAKARSIVIIPARNPEHKLYVRVKPLVGIKLPFIKSNQKIKPRITETEYGYVIYPSKGLYNAAWNGEKHIIMKHTRLSFGNTWVVAGEIPAKPTRVEKVMTAKGPIEVDVYEWRVDPLGNLMAERAQKEIETLRSTLEIVKEQLEKGWELANTIAAEPEEFFDRIRDKAKKDTLETIDVVGSTVFKEITATLRQAYKYAQAAEKRDKGRKEEGGE